jgi:hypothetical protein
VIQVDYADSMVPEVTLTTAYDFAGNRVWLSDSKGARVEYAWLNQRLQSMPMTSADFKSTRMNFA